VTQEWGIVRASLRQHLVLPGVARLAGAFGSQWMTDLVVFNPLDTEQAVAVKLTDMGGEVTTAVVNEIQITLQPREIRVVRDVVGALFGIANGGGVLHLQPETAVTASARTYSRKGEGTFGFGMQAIDFYNAAGPNFPLYFAGAFLGPHYRTNMVLTDTSGRGAGATLQAHGILGMLGDQQSTIIAPPAGIAQYNAIAERLGLLPSEYGGLTVRTTRGTAIASVVAIDNRTNDPTWFPPELSASITRVIPAIGHLDGAFGSKFRSDLYLINPSNEPRTVNLTATPWDNGSATIVRTFTLLPYESRIIPDVLKTLFSTSGIASLRYSSTFNEDAVRVTSRTYNIGEDGGTFGCLVPPFNQFQLAGPGDVLEIVAAGGAGFRTNLALLEVGAAGVGDMSATVTVFDGSGMQLDRFTVRVPGRTGTQINDLFGSRGLPVPEAAWIVVEVGQGVFGAYVTMTDNITNDSTFVAAQLGGKPN
jgi:hypothetical protein